MISMAETMAAVTHHAEHVIDFHVHMADTFACRCGNPYPCDDRLTAETAIEAVGKLALLTPPAGN
jgi:hypothetical protein